MNLELRSLQSAHSKYTKAVLRLEDQISPYVKFVFSITFDRSDGFLLLNEEEASVSRLDQCLSVIKRTGVLSVEDHQNLSI